jgi:hypothetical protein
LVKRIRKIDDNSTNGIPGRMWANANLVEMQHGPFNNKSDYYVIENCWWSTKGTKPTTAERFGLSEQ